MKNSKAEYIRHQYIATKSLASVLHFEMSSQSSKIQLTDQLKLSKDRGYSQASGVLYWLHLREETKWSRPMTGLRPVGNNTYYGDIKIKGKKSLLVFQLDSNEKHLVIDVFRGFYPSNKGILVKLLTTHSYYHL